MSAVWGQKNTISMLHDSGSSVLFRTVDCSKFIRKWISDSDWNRTMKKCVWKREREKEVEKRVQKENESGWEKESERLN